MPVENRAQSSRANQRQGARSTGTGVDMIVNEGEAGKSETCFIPPSRIGLPANPWHSEHRTTPYLGHAGGCAGVSVLWMLASALLFSMMGASIKLATTQYSTAEILFYRSLVGVIIIGLYMYSRRESVRTLYWSMHLSRSIAGVLAMSLWFVAFAFLPVATAMTLNYTSPIWMALILALFQFQFKSRTRRQASRDETVQSVWRGRKRGFVQHSCTPLKPVWHASQTVDAKRAQRCRQSYTNKMGLELAPLIRKQPSKIDLPLIFTILISFMGVVFLLQPTIASHQWLGSLFGLASGLVAAVAYLSVRRLGEYGEPETRIVFYLSLTGVVVGGGWMMLTDITAHTTPGLILLIAVGIFATLAQLALTRAYRYGNTLLVANFHYMGIVFAAIWGVLIWHDSLNILSWTGVALIIGGGICATFFRMRALHTRKAA